MPGNVTLLHLPPYAPELNPVENVRAYLRSSKLSNRVLDACDAIVDACCNAWLRLAAQPDRLTSIASRQRPQVNQ